jgi:hypothetical protein
MSCVAVVNVEEILRYKTFEGFRKKQVSCKMAKNWQ